MIPYEKIHIIEECKGEIKIDKKTLILLLTIIETVLN